MYKLKPDIVYNNLFKQIAKCKGSVSFKTINGDVFNLNSIFSRFVFITFMSNKELLKTGQLLFDISDLPLLKEYLVEVKEEDSAEPSL